MENTSIPQPRSRRPLIIVVSIVALILFAGGTTLALKALMPQTKPVATTPGQTPAMLVSEFTKNNSTLSSSSYTTAKDTNQTYLPYTDSAHSYLVNILADSSVTSYAQNAKTPDQSTAIKDQTKAYMTTKGFAPVSQPTQSGVKGIERLTFANADTICQLKALLPTADSIASYTFACATQQSVAKEYTTVDQLLHLYKPSLAAGSYTEALRVNTTEGNKTASIMTLTAEKGPQTQQLFVSVDGTWKYIAAISNGNEADANSNGKYTPSDALTAALKDPTYGEFLTKLFS